MAFEICATDGFQRLTAGLTCTAEEFSTFYLQAQGELPFEQRIAFDVLAIDAQTNGEASVMAFRYAYNQNWFVELMMILITENGLSDDYLRFLSDNEEQGSAVLQAVTNMTRGYMIPDLSIKGISDSIRWTGQVAVGGRSLGSGILIGPNLFLTAWHVIKSLFNTTPQGFVPDPDKYDRLEIIFDNFDTFSHDRMRQIIPVPVRIQAAREWCVAFSPCHSAELAKRNPTDLSELRGHWDYAVIRLSKPVGLQRRYVRADPRSVVPRVNEPVTVFQYPETAPLRFDQSELIGPSTEERPFVPALRFLHNVNTHPGSSGSPCFDRVFNCFGIHQGVWRTGTNKGIPLTAILQDIAERYQELPVLRPEEHPIWTLDETAPEPVIGCDDFQSLIWRSAFTGKPRLILIEGDRGAGKSFRLKILQKMLGEGGHLKIRLKAEAISKLDAPGFLNYIAVKLKTEFTEPVNFSDENSSPAVWLRDEIIPALINMLNIKREGRLVWMLFSDLNNYVLEGRYLQDLFFMIVEQVKNENWLRIVIDGGFPQVPQDVLVHTQLHHAGPVQQQEIETFFRYYMGHLSGNYDPQVLYLVVEEAMNIYNRELINNRPGAAGALKLRLFEIMERLTRI